MRWSTAKAEVTSEHGMVATKHPLATAVGLRVLQEGGNAMDAAVAAAFALGVVEPWMSGLGGGGYLVHRAGRDGAVRVIDFAMVAPRDARVDLYPLDEAGGLEPELSAWPLTAGRRQALGPLAVAVPGAPAGLAFALRRLGTLDLAAAIAPAIGLAETGWHLDWYAFLQIALDAPRLAADPGIRDVFFEGAYPIGLNASETQPLIRQPELARTLRTLAAEGADTFYRGDLAAKIVRAVGAAGGILTMSDLAAYTARETEPLVAEYAGKTVCTTQPGSGGPAVLEILRGLGGGGAPRSPESVVRFAGAARAAMNAHAEGASAAGRGSTTHLSVVDRERNMVSLTSTLHSRFGARFSVAGTGIMLNNGMLWFDPRPGRPLSVRPGERVPSNMSPTIVADGRHPLATLGASGGRRIPCAVAQLVHDLVVHGLDPQDALALPRLDTSGPTVLIDARLGDEVASALRQDGHEALVIEETLYPQYFASVVGIKVDPITGLLRGGADPFTTATCLGY